MPIRIVPQVSITLPKVLLDILDAKAYCQMLLSGDTESKESFNFDQSVMSGIEFGTYSNRVEFAFDSSLRFDYTKQITRENLNFYLRLKIDWYRF